MALRARKYMGILADLSIMAAPNATEKGRYDTCALGDTGERSRIEGRMQGVAMIDPHVKSPYTLRAKLSPGR